MSPPVQPNLSHFTSYVVDETQKYPIRGICFKAPFATPLRFWRLFPTLRPRDDCQADEAGCLTFNHSPESMTGAALIESIEHNLRSDYLGQNDRLSRMAGRK